MIQISRFNSLEIIRQSLQYKTNYKNNLTLVVVLSKNS